ncbi:MAG: hypothetical protein PHT12_00380 [Patescibacteria group bacterium]|nr:hypothetical protein [Patescibacteria group bacterium]
MSSTSKYIVSLLRPSAILPTMVMACCAVGQYMIFNRPELYLPWERVCLPLAVLVVSAAIARHRHGAHGLVAGIVVCIASAYTTAFTSTTVAANTWRSLMTHGWVLLAMILVCFVSSLALFASIALWGQPSNRSFR